MMDLEHINTGLPDIKLYDLNHPAVFRLIKYTVPFSESSNYQKVALLYSVKLFFL